MTRTIVESVEKWYADNSGKLSSIWSTLRIKSKDRHSAKGKVVIEFENPRVLGSVTFWNNSSVTALAVERESGTERILDDRRVNSTESIPTLLEGYFRHFSGLGGSGRAE